MSPTHSGMISPTDSDEVAHHSRMMSEWVGDFVGIRSPDRRNQGHTVRPYYRVDVPME
jgi:hypothetical protein